MSNNKKHTFLIVLLSAFIFIGCKKANQGIPYVNVDIYININNPAYFKLTSIGGSELISGGSKGIIVYRKQNNEFMCYDRHCTYNPDDACGAAEIDVNQVEVSCDCDGSRYLIQDGSVVNGPATFGLHKYNSDFDGQTLHIYN